MAADPPKLMAQHVPRRLDLRQRRAQRLAAEIMHLVAPHIDPRGDTSVRRISDAILDLLAGQGIEVLSDFDRAEIGLAPRDGLGWTAAEIRAYDMRLLEALVTPDWVSVSKMPGEP